MMILDETSVGMVYMHAPGINTGMNCEHINASNRDHTKFGGGQGHTSSRFIGS
jgi:hypothetical protein